MKTEFRVYKDGEVWGIRFTEELAVVGFKNDSDAFVWLMEYIFRSMSEIKSAELAKQREEMRKQMLGAAILAPKTEDKKQ